MDYREQNRVFDGFAAFVSTTYNLTGSDDPQRLRGTAVSPSLFPLLGVGLARGRFFTEEEGQEGRDQVVILGHGLWARQFGADPSLLGKTITLSGNPYLVVGVMPAKFQFPPPYSSYGEVARPAELFVPLTFTPDQLNARLDHNWQVAARLKQGVTLAQAQADMEVLNKRIEENYAADHSGIGIEVVPLTQQIVGPFRPPLLVLLGAVGFVLLIACANVANLFLARATAREKELAIRLALGANRFRLIRQLLTESILLALLGGGAGLLLARWSVEALPALSPGNIPRLELVTIDAWMLGFTLAVSLLTGIVFGLLPALQASRTDLHDSLKEGSRSAAGGGQYRFRSALVVAEVALSLVLLIGAGLLMRGFLQLQGTDVGFDPENVLTMQLSIPRSKYEGGRVAAFYQQLLHKLAALPGVVSAGAANTLPLTGGGWETIATIEGRPIDDLSKMNVSAAAVVTPDYFRAMRIPLLQGRAFAEEDAADGTPVVIIDGTFAKRFLPGKDPLRRRAGRSTISPR